MARKVKRRPDVAGDTGDGEPIVREPLPDPVVANAAPSGEAVPEPELPAPEAAEAAPEAAPGGPGTGKKRGRPKGSKMKRGPVAPDFSTVTVYAGLARQLFGGIGFALRDPDSFAISDEQAMGIAIPAAQVFPAEEIDPKLALLMAVGVVAASCTMRHLAVRAERKALTKPRIPQGAPPAMAVPRETREAPPLGAVEMEPAKPGEMGPRADGKSTLAAELEELRGRLA